MHNHDPFQTFAYSGPTPFGSPYATPQSLQNPLMLAALQGINPTIPQQYPQQGYQGIPGYGGIQQQQLNPLLATILQNQLQNQLQTQLALQSLQNLQQQNPLQNLLQNPLLQNPLMQNPLVQNPILGQGGFGSPFGQQHGPYQQFGQQLPPQTWLGQSGQWGGGSPFGGINPLVAQLGGRGFLTPGSPWSGGGF